MNAKLQTNIFYLQKRIKKHVTNIPKNVKLCRESCISKSKLVPNVNITFTDNTRFIDFRTYYYVNPTFPDAAAPAIIP